MFAAHGWRTFKGFMLVGLIAAAFPVSRASAQTPDYASLLAAPDRTDADRQADKRRDPLPFLVFAGVRPGMKVVDMGAGGGYSTELMARAAAPNGIVYGQNPPDVSDKIKAAFEARLQTLTPDGDIGGFIDLAPVVINGQQVYMKSVNYETLDLVDAGQTVQRSVYYLIDPDLTAMALYLNIWTPGQRDFTNLAPLCVVNVAAQ